MDTYFKHWATSVVANLDSEEKIEYFHDLLYARRIVVSLTKEFNLSVAEASSIAERISSLDRKCFTAEEMALAFLNITRGVDKSCLKPALDALSNDELEGFLYDEVEYSATNAVMSMLGVVPTDSFAAWAKRFAAKEEYQQ